MDILINILTRDILTSHVTEFINIIKGEPYEYWQEDHLKSELPGKYDLSIVTFLEGSIAGYIIASLKETGPYIHKFMVRKDFRRMKIGEKMLRFFEKNVSEKGYSSIELTVRDDNLQAIRFYERNLFVVIGKRIDSINNSILNIMHKQLV